MRWQECQPHSFTTGDIEVNTFVEFELVCEVLGFCRNDLVNGITLCAVEDIGSLMDVVDLDLNLMLI